MLKKLFKRSSVPTKDGIPTPKSLEKLRFVKKYELQLSNMEESPLYSLTHQLTVGSEIGNIIIADPSISPRHASFILQDQVVSIIDHGSISGTYVNGTKIAPGKYIILNEEDTILVGELELKLHATREAAPAEVIPEIPVERNEIAIDIPEKVPGRPIDQKKFDPQQHLKAHSKKIPKKMSYKDERAANAVIRAVAIGVDLLLTYSILILFTPFDDFKNVLGEVQKVGTEIFLSLWALASPYLQDFGFIEEMFKDFYSFASSTFHFEPILVVFFLIRFLTTFIFGVSIGQYLVGIKGTKSFVWDRVGGVIRVILGVFTGPFLIFDIPAVVSRRTLKEMVSFTRIETPSRIKSILSSIFIPILLIAIGIIAPLFQGLELSEPVLVNDKLDKRIRVQNLESDEPKEMISDLSHALGLELNYDKKELLIIPSFSFHGNQKKLSLKNSLVFYQNEFNRGIEFEVLKKFDLKQLLEIGLKSDPFLKDKFPELAGFAFSGNQVNPNFKKNIQEAEQEAFANEFIKFTQLAFTLSIDNVLEVLEKDTYLLKGLVDYKTTFLSLIEYKDFDEVGYIKIGNGTFMRFVFSEKQNPFDLLIPLTRGDGRIIKVTWDKKEKYESSRSKFYKYNLNELNIFPLKAESVKSELTAFSVYDLFSKEDFKQELANPEIAQALYGYYFETSGKVLQSGDEELLEIWRSKASNLLKIFEALAGQSEDDMKSKLIQNFKDLNDALLNKNFEYFGVTQGVMI